MNPEDVEALRRGAEAPARAAPGDIDEAAADLAAAFADDALFDWVLRRGARRDAGRLSLFRLMLRGLGGADSAVVRPAQGGAASVWLTSQMLGHGGFWRELQALPTLLRATGLRRFGRMAAMRAAMDANHPMARPHAYLWFLGVRPDLQALGLGSRLLKAGLATVDARKLPVFLETAKERNLGFYRRYGFEVTGEYLIARGSPRVWTMWREAVA